MRITLNDDGGYSFDQEEVIGDLLRQRTRGCKFDAHTDYDGWFDVKLGDAELLSASNKRDGPTIRKF